MKVLNPAKLFFPKQSWFYQNSPFIINPVNLLGNSPIFNIPLFTSRMCCAFLVMCMIYAAADYLNTMFHKIVLVIKI